jgi:predicted DNA-binding transcriptional regulator YafY
MLPKKLQTNNKLERISYLYDRLSKAEATITELANELSVSTKTIQRDLHEILSEAGAVCNGRSWKIDKSKSKDTLRGDERIILEILDELAKGAGKQFYNKAHNLIEQISSNLNHPIYASLDSEALNPEHLETFALLENAIKNRQTIKCKYGKGQFELKPLKLAFFDGFWYLLCLDTKTKDKFKKFHLKTMKSIELGDGSFEIPKELEERLVNANSIWFDIDAKPFTVRLFVEKDVLKYFERKPMKAQHIESRYPDGTAEITIEATHEMDVLPLVLWYIPHIKVMEPQWLADMVKEKLEWYLREIH